VVVAVCVVSVDAVGAVVVVGVVVVVVGGGDVGVVHWRCDSCC